MQLNKKCQGFKTDTMFKEMMETGTTQKKKGEMRLRPGWQSEVDGTGKTADLNPKLVPGTGQQNMIAID